MLRNVLWCLLLAGFVGCGNENLDQMKASPAELKVWDALSELETGDDGLMTAGQAIDQKDWNRAKAYFKGPAFEAAIGKFEQAALPAGWADRTEAKNEVVTQLKSLAEAAKGGAGEDKLKSGWDSLSKALAKLSGASEKPAE